MGKEEEQKGTRCLIRLVLYTRHQRRFAPCSAESSTSNRPSVSMSSCIPNVDTSHSCVT